MSREPLAPATRYTQPAALDQFQVDLGAKLTNPLILDEPESAGESMASA